MSQRSTGGPAFPIVAEQDVIEMGLSKRDYFAAKVAQALIGNSEQYVAMGDIGVRESKSPAEVIAGMSYMLADAMLKAREA